MQPYDEYVRGGFGTFILDAAVERIESRDGGYRIVTTLDVKKQNAMQQHLDVSDTEIDERIAGVLRSAARERDRLAEIYRTPEARRDVRERIAQEKALDWIAGHARVTSDAQN